jgi:hypothetical protein
MMTEQLDNAGRTLVTQTSPGRHGPDDFDVTEHRLEDLPPLQLPRPLGARAWRWLRIGRVPASVLVAAVAASAALAAAGAHVADRYEQTWAQNATVSLLAEVPYDGVSQAGGGTRDELVMDGIIQFINTGPATVQVLDVQAAQSGVAISRLNSLTSIGAGKPLQVNVHVTMACMAYVLQEPITLRVTVRAADGHTELVQIPLDAKSSAWGDQQFHACRW